MFPPLLPGEPLHWFNHIVTWNGWHQTSSSYHHHIIIISSLYHHHSTFSFSRPSSHPRSTWFTRMVSVTISSYHHHNIFIAPSSYHHHIIIITPSYHHLILKSLILPLCTWYILYVYMNKIKFLFNILSHFYVYVLFAIKR